MWEDGDKERWRVRVREGESENIENMYLNYGLLNYVKHLLNMCLKERTIMRNVQ